MAKGTSLTISLPPPLAAAVDGEARRRLVTRSQVIADALRSELPRRLAADLVPVLDVEGEEVELAVAELAERATT